MRVPLCAGPFSCSEACSPIENFQGQQHQQQQQLLCKVRLPTTAPGPRWASPPRHQPLTHALTSLPTQVSSTSSSSSSHSRAPVSPTLRASMVDFMSSTASALHLCSDALFMGVALMDRYLAAAVPTPQQLGCTACACLSVASKYEQAASPPLRAFLAFLSPHHTLCQLQEAEVEVLRALDYRISNISTTKQHLAALFQQLNAAGPLDANLYHLAGYLAELTLLEYNLCETAPEPLAAACLAYALVLLGCGVSDAGLVKATGMSLVQLQGPLTWLAAVHTTVCAAAGNGCPYAATRKYTHSSCCGVATIPPLHL